MNRQVRTAAVIVALIAVGCGPQPASRGPSQPAETAGAPSAPASSATPGPGWTPGATVTLGAASALPLGDFLGTRLTTTPAGFALIGQDGSQAPFFVSGSADGQSWSRLDTTALGGDLSDLAAGARGAVLAASDASGATGHVWFSTDGLTWGRIDQPVALTHVAVTALFAGGAGFALAGDDGSGADSVPTVWTSPDGHDWHEAAALRGVGIAQLRVLAGGFVAINPSDATPLIQVSVDGTTWHAVPAANVGPINLDEDLITTTNSQLIVVRGAGADGGLDAWAGTVDPAAGTIDWQQAADAGFAGADFVALAGTPSTGTLLGYDRSSVVPVAWTTSDGLDWTRHDLAADSLGGGVSGLLASSGTTTISLGWASDANDRLVRQLWRSNDGVGWTPVTSGPLANLAPLSRSQCPAALPSSASELLAIAPELRPFCFGDEALTVTGYVVDCGGCGGVSSMTASPSWLIEPLGYSRFWLSPSETGNISSGIGVDVDPAHPIKIPSFGARVLLTGHFADPASPTCRLVPLPGSGAELPPPSEAILRCREEFVATGVTIPSR